MEKDQEEQLLSATEECDTPSDTDQVAAQSDSPDLPARTTRRQIPNGEASTAENEATLTTEKPETGTEKSTQGAETCCSDANCCDNASDNCCVDGECCDNTDGCCTVENLDTETEQIQAAQDEKKVLQIELATLKEELERARADYYNLNQEYTNYVRRSKLDLKRAKEEGNKAVFKVLLTVLDDIYAAKAAGELEGPFQAIANKMTASLETNFGLTQYGEVGEDFDPNLHEALMAQENPEVETPQIAQVLQPGYKLGEEILRATKVIVNNPA